MSESYRTTADVLGIKFEEPFGARRITAEDERTIVSIGQIVVIDGTIHVVPRPALSANEAEILREFAEDAFFNPPHLNDEWEHSGGVGEPSRWTTHVSVMYPASRCSAMAPDFSMEG